MLGDRWRRQRTKVMRLQLPNQYNRILSVFGFGKWAKGLSCLPLRLICPKYYLKTGTFCYITTRSQHVGTMLRTGRRHNCYPQRNPIPTIEPTNSTPHTSGSNGPMEICGAGSGLQLAPSMLWPKGAKNKALQS